MGQVYDRREGALCMEGDSVSKLIQHSFASAWVMAGVELKDML